MYFWKLLGGQSHAFNNIGGSCDPPWPLLTPQMCAPGQDSTPAINSNSQSPESNPTPEYLADSGSTDYGSFSATLFWDPHPKLKSCLKWVICFEVRIADVFLLLGIFRSGSAQGVCNLTNFCSSGIEIDFCYLPNIFSVGTTLSKPSVFFPNNSLETSRKWAF